MRRDILGICNAYEQGFGHGLDRRTLKNPYVPDADEWFAWDYGYNEGHRKAVEKADNQRHGGL